MPCKRRRNLLFGSLLLTVAGSCGGPARVQKDFEVLGAPASVELHATTEGAAREALTEIEAVYRRVGASLSLADPGSELSRLNRVAGDANYTIKDHDLYRCILLALDWAKASDGAYSPVVGSHWSRVKVFEEARGIRFRDAGTTLDLSGIVDGHVVDIATRILARPGMRGGLLSLGRARYAWGHPRGRRPWSVPIRDPGEPRLDLGTVELMSRGMFVSRAVEDPLGAATAPVAPGEPRGHETLAAVAIADTAADAQAVGGALLALDPARAGGLLERTRRVEALLLVRRPEGPVLLASGSLQGRLHIDDRFAEQIGGRVRYILPPLTFP